MQLTEIKKKKKKRRDKVWGGIPFGELEADLKADGFDPTSGEVRLIGVEAIAVRGDHFG